MNRTIFLSSVATLSLIACNEQPADPAPALAEEAQSKPMPAPAPISAAESIDAGLAVGDQVPLTTGLESADGATDLKTVLANGPALLVFTRSVEWCPYCQTQLKSINAMVGDLQDRGYGLFGISYDSADQQDRFSKNQMLQYRMLSDEGSVLIDAFGLRDPQYTEGRAVGVAYASVYVVDQNGTVIAKSVSGDYKKRPTNDQILALVDAI